MTGGSRWTEENVERLAEALWAYEGDPAVDWKGVADPQFGRQGEAVRLRAKAETLLGVVFSGEEARCEAILPVFGLVERCVLAVGHSGYHRTRGGEEFRDGDTLTPDEAYALQDALRTHVLGDPTLDNARRVLQRIIDSADREERDD